MSDSLAVSTPAGTGGQVARWSTRPVPGAGLLGRWPELVPIAATAAAWACLALTGPATQPGAAHAGRAHAGPLAALPGAGGVVHLVAMTVAMTGLLAVPGARTAVFASSWWRRRRAVTLFVAGFFLAWTAAVLGLHAVAVALSVLAEPAAAGGALLAGCALAQLHPRRSRRAAECDRTMRIRPYGRSADLDCVRFGVVSVARCTRLCALPMLAMLLLPGSLPLTAALATLALVERVSRRRWPVPAALSYAALAVTALA